jgi:hypothetical protein
MIYIGAFRMFWIFFLLLACAIMAGSVLKYKAATRGLVGALLGSLGGYFLAPLVGALLGNVPTIMIEPYYFTHPFYGCIAPWPLLLAWVTSISGTLLGLFAGTYMGFRFKAHA